MTDSPPLQIVPATREGIKALIGVYGRSGGGKTRTALILARGIVGPKGRIVLIDTETGRGKIFADVIMGGYSVIDLDSPFSPERYGEALHLAERSADIVVFDSMTHEWDGEGGVLDLQEQELSRMAGEDYRRREACKMAAWIKPKMAHKRFVQALLRSKLPIICCLRAQEKTHIGKDKSGKTEVYTDEFTSPIYDPRFIFEMLVNMEVYAKDAKGGYVHVTKITHEGLWSCLPKETEQLSYAHGEAIAKWCASPGTKPEGKKDDLKVLKRELWNLTKPKHNEQAAMLERWLIDEAIISDTENLDSLTVEKLPGIIAKAKEKLNQKPEGKLL